MNEETICTEREVSALSRPALIEQRSAAGLDLEPANYAVIAWSAWIDMNMPQIYQSKTIWPGVGLS